MEYNHITISNVYDYIPENEKNYYKRFFEEGKRKANLLKKGHTRNRTVQAHETETGSAHVNVRENGPAQERGTRPYH